MIHHRHANTITNPSRSASSFSGVDRKASCVSIFSRSKYNYSRSQKRIVVYCSMHGAINYNLLNLRRRERSPARQFAANIIRIYLDTLANPHRPGRISKN